MDNLTLIESEEWCSFETFGIPAIKARVDSGAKTSSIQANSIKIFFKETGRARGLEMVFLNV